MTKQLDERQSLLARELDQSPDSDADLPWIEEAQRRYAAFQKGELESLDGGEVMEQCRHRLMDLHSVKLNKDS